MQIILLTYLLTYTHHRHHHHYQNAWAAEASSADLVRRKCPRPTARFHSWRMEAASHHQSGVAKSALEVRVVPPALRRAYLDEQ